MAKKTAQLNVRVEEEDIETLLAIEKEHYINPSLLTRGLIKAAVAFYKKNGWFSFPVTVSCVPPFSVGGTVVPDVVKSLQQREHEKEQEELNAIKADEAAAAELRAKARKKKIRPAPLA